MQNRALFKGIFKTLTSQYTQIYVKEFLPKDYINEYESNIEPIQKRFKSELEIFIKKEMDEINNYIINNFV